MKFALLAVAAVFAFAFDASALEPSFDIRTELSRGKTKISSPRLLVLPGREASITQITRKTDEEITVKVVAKDAAKGQIHMKFNVTFRRGNETVEEAPEFILPEGKIGHIPLNGIKGERLKFRVKAKRTL